MILAASVTWWLAEWIKPIICFNFGFGDGQNLQSVWQGGENKGTTKVTQAGRSVSQPIEKPKGCKPVQQPGSPQLCHKSLHLVVTQALGQATCKLPRSTDTKRLTPSGTGMALRRGRTEPMGSGPCKEAGLDHRGKGQLVVQHLCSSVSAPIHHVLYTVLHIGFAGRFATPYALHNGKIANQWW